MGPVPGPKWAPLEALMAAPHSSSLHTTAAASKLQLWSFTVPHSPWCFTSTLPSQWWAPSFSLTSRAAEGQGHRRHFRRQCRRIVVIFKNEISDFWKKILCSAFLDFYGINIPTWPTLSPQSAITEPGAGREAPGVSQEPVEATPGTPSRIGLQRLWMLPSL